MASTTTTTVTIDDGLLERAIVVSGIEKKDDVLREALTALIHREAARRLARLGGTEPDLVTPPRRSSYSLPSLA